MNLLKRYGTALNKSLRAPESERGRTVDEVFVDLVMEGKHAIHRMTFDIAPADTGVLVTARYKQHFAFSFAVDKPFARQLGEHLLALTDEPKPDEVVDQPLPQASEASPPNASASPSDEGTSTSSSDR